MTGSAGLWEDVFGSRPALLFGLIRSLAALHWYEIPPVPYTTAGYRSDARWSCHLRQCDTGPVLTRWVFDGMNRRRGQACLLAARSGFSFFGHDGAARYSRQSHQTRIGALGLIHVTSCRCKTTNRDNQIQAPAVASRISGKQSEDPHDHAIAAKSRRILRQSRYCAAA